MSRQDQKTTRDIRKRLLQLEAETYRLSLMASLHELRQPIRTWSLPENLTSLLGAKSGLLATIGSLVVGRKLNQFSWIAKALPLALAGWRIAGLVRGMVGKHKHAKAGESN